MHPLQRFRKDKRGIFWVTFVAVSTIIIATTAWLIVILVANNFLDTFSSQATGAMTVSLGETTILQGSVVIVIVDFGMVAWMVVSAFIRERQEAPLS